MEIGKRLDPFSQEILALFPEVEGDCNFYYGKIRNGKTRCATEDIIELLRRGEIVYANWPVNFSGFDERSDWKTVFIKSLFGRKIFFKYGPENFTYFHPDEIDINFLGRLVNVHVFIDEGQWIFNSHDRNADEDKRRLILHNGHYCRSLNIISQRPVNVFKDMRSQINTWYKCEKLLSFPFLLFRRSTITEMKDDLPDEEQIDDVKIYWPWNNKLVFEAYNTHAMRADNAIECLPEFEAYEIDRLSAFKVLASHLIPKRKARLKGLVKPLAGPHVEARPFRVDETKGGAMGQGEPLASILAREAPVKRRLVDMIRVP